MENTEKLVGYKTNRFGHLVPIEKISEVDLLRDELVQNALGRGRALREEMENFKDHLLGEIAALSELSAERYGAKLGGRKGNITLLSYDGLQKVQYCVQDVMSFNEGLQAAKVLIDELLHEWTAEANADLRTLINSAFDVDKEGNINTARILALRKVKIEDERWLRAMDAIADALEVVLTRAYVRLYERDNEEAPWAAVSLDLAKL